MTQTHKQTSAHHMEQPPHHCSHHHHHHLIFHYPHPHPHHHHHHHHVTIMPNCNSHNNFPQNPNSNFCNHLTPQLPQIPNIGTSDFQPSLDIQNFEGDGVIEYEEDEEEDPVFVMTDEWREFFAKSEARRREAKKLAKKQRKKT